MKHVALRIASLKAVCWFRSANNNNNNNGYTGRRHARQARLLIYIPSK